MIDDFFSISNSEQADELKNGIFTDEREIKVSMNSHELRIMIKKKNNFQI